MELIDRGNLTTFLSFIPSIKKQKEEWYLISMAIKKPSSGNIIHLSNRMKKFFQSKEGKIFACNESELLILVKLGPSANTKTVEDNVLSALTNYNCKISSADVTEQGLQRIRLLLTEQKESVLETMSVLYKERKNRKENIIMVADDDMFMRSLVSKALGSYGKIVELPDGENVTDTYLEISPDVLFLDIHLPGRSGMEILDEINNFDQSAYIVMLSADSNKDNVVKTRKNGAKGFVAKPFTKDKLIESMSKCTTITKP